ncbi:aldehyde dehydrogenase (NADP(+)) [Microbacterium pseudoresistens]|uniref:NADP-dependent aldehyde dehydrogenase n=1 Tax=Microbacterium pseudoresistens TaxID=640634 RepID=A0A7Y9ESW5_9MICO|nr:aldehyde dehydrogenase (NADP(+)) [Microbacterium pseudoresistens]NYD53339.1 NADP-dependent aldehyde dehydrogenase [Microbacterium pseudoresistens]
MNTSAHDLEAATAAAAAFRLTRRATALERAGWLTAIADRLEEHADELVALAHSETRLGADRLAGELRRTTGQLRFFASVILDGAYLEAIVDHARSDLPVPTPDLRRMLVPIGPVAVFSASNFPFAFSVAGGDTASALAAGNPVVVKGHSAHAELSRRTAALVADALTAAGAPSGTFGHVTGRKTGLDLVGDPAIAAVGFTGSLEGGRALMAVAQARPVPIPFYGELSAVNPVVITARAAEKRADELASGLAASFQLGGGQFCTKPGVVFAPSGARVAERVASLLGSGMPLLSEPIERALLSGLDRLSALPGMRVLRGVSEDPNAVAPAVLTTTADRVLADPQGHLVECFGPVTLVVEYDDLHQVVACVRVIGGSLTATVHSQSEDDIRSLVDELTLIAGRVLFDGWPTGVAVNWAQHHGGPWPSTTSAHTSVGATATRRFLRPIAWQATPDGLLPPELQESNPLGIPRRVDGVQYPAVHKEQP